MDHTASEHEGGSGGGDRGGGRALSASTESGIGTSAESRPPVIGIMVWGKQELVNTPFLRRFGEEGHRLGIVVYYFSPEDFLLSEGDVAGIAVCPDGGLTSGRFGLPDLIIDRCQQHRKKPPTLDSYFFVRKHAAVPFANDPIGNKLQVYRVLAETPDCSARLPETAPYSEETLRAMLSRCPAVYVKPRSGTGGRGVLRIARLDAGYAALGRTLRRTKTSARFDTWDALLDWVRPWVNRTPFLVQQGLTLGLLPGRVVDLRVLMQKNGRGGWTVAGCGLRIGGEDSPTSNLHGGGRGAPVAETLERRFGAQAAGTIVDECLRLAHCTAHALERHGCRIIELGVDIGIDTGGAVWLIEANSMPQREILRQTGQDEAYAQSFRRPLEYALYVIGRRDAGGL